MANTLSISANLENTLKDMQVVVPFLVVEWEARETEWEPVFAAKTLAEATQFVREAQEKFPDTFISWDIHQDVQMPLSHLAKLECR